MANAAAEQPTEQNWRIQDIKSWPGALGIYNYSKKAVLLNIGSLILVYLGSIIAGSPFSLIGFFGPKDNFLFTLVLNFIQFIVSIFFMVAMYIILLDSIRSTKSDWIIALKKSTKLFINALLAFILVSLIIFGSLLAFIIPFFFIAPRMMNVFYFLIDQDMGVIDSIKASWNSTHNNVGKVYGIIGVWLLFTLPVITLIGIPFAIYLSIMYAASSAIYYEYTRQNMASDSGAPTTSKK